MDARRMEKSRMVHAPFQIDVAEEVLMDLRQRLARTRWPDELPDAEWDYGTSLAYLRQLVSYWHGSYDWRAQERFLNTFPQFTTEIDGIHLHFLHVKGKGTHPAPLLISHGWPGSFFEMYKIIGPLTDPVRYGGDPADAFDVWLWLLRPDERAWRHGGTDSRGLCLLNARPGLPALCRTGR